MAMVLLEEECPRSRIFMGGGSGWELFMCAGVLNTLLSFRIGVGVGTQAESASSGRSGTAQIAERCTGEGRIEALCRTRVAQQNDIKAPLFLLGSEQTLPKECHSCPFFLFFVSTVDP